MYKFFALFYMLLSFAGCDQGRTVVVHSIANGRDVVYSKVHVAGQLATFQCMRSESGACHYTVVANDCAPAGISCPSPPTSFAVQAGGSRSFTNLPAGFQSCVTATGTPDGDCAQLASTTASTSP